MTLFVTLAMLAAIGVAAAYFTLTREEEPETHVWTPDELHEFFVRLEAWESADPPIEFGPETSRALRESLGSFGEKWPPYGSEERR